MRLSLIILTLFALSIKPLCGQDSGESLYRIQNMELQDLYEKADSLLVQGKADSAALYYIVLAGKYSPGLDEEDKRLCAKAYTSIGNIYFLKESYFQSFEFYLKGLNICEQNGFDDMLAQCYNSIGNFYSVFNDEALAEQYYSKGLEYAIANGNTDVKIKILINLTVTYCYLGDTQKAREQYDECVQYADKDAIIGYFTDFNRAFILSCEDKYREAISAFKSAGEFADSMNLEPRYLNSVYGEIARQYEFLDMPDSALHWRLINQAYSEEHGLSATSNLNALSALYGEIGNRQLEQYYKEQYWIAYDSVFNRSRYNEAKNSQFVYEMDKIYKEVASLTTAREQDMLRAKSQQRILALSAVALAIFIVLFSIVYTQKRKLSKTYKDLVERIQERITSENTFKSVRKDYETSLAREKQRYEELEKLMPVASRQSMESPTDKLKVTIEDGNEATGTADSNENRPSGLPEEQKKQLRDAILNYMDIPENFCDPDFSLEKLAKSVNSNTKYVSAIINESFNKNFRSFLNEYRIREAITRLSSQEYDMFTIKAIGESVGYKSSTNFIDAFRKATGITPSLYQKIAKTGKGAKD